MRIHGSFGTLDLKMYFLQCMSVESMSAVEYNGLHCVAWKKQAKHCDNCLPQIYCYGKYSLAMPQ